VNRVTNSVEETETLAAEVAGVAQPGDLIVLVGGLGAGKTRFVQGFARAMGVEEPVTSPTFALVHNYEGRVPVLHADLYRMVSEHEVLDLGIDEALADGAIALVEWGDIASDVLSPNRLTVTITDVDETSRAFALEGWTDRLPS
jgi:tRNA threonylcarbamoyladenosine biosynthesis protein TsaE